LILHVFCPEVTRYTEPGEIWCAKLTRCQPSREISSGSAEQ